MYHAKWIIGGLLIFIVLLSFPVWFSLGQPTYEAPDLMLPEEEEQCVEDADWMRDNHMWLLDNWRDSVVRDGESQYVSSTGQEYDMSLQKTCMSCHESKEQFCDACHDTVSTDPYCWDCHVAPEEVGNGQQ